MSKPIDQKNTATQIVEAIGRKRLASRLGVVDHAISTQVARGKFPASWFCVVQQECEAIGIDCPVDIFGMRSAGE